MCVDAGPHPQALTDRQAEVLEFIRRYVAVVGEGCPASVISRRLDIHHEAVRMHFAALHRKGWLSTPSSPAYPINR